jgi:hypothetical protein
MTGHLVILKYCYESVRFAKNLWLKVLFASLLRDTVLTEKIN